MNSDQTNKRPASQRVSALIESTSSSKQTNKRKGPGSKQGNHLQISIPSESRQTSSGSQATSSGSQATSSGSQATSSGSQARSGGSQARSGGSAATSRQDEDLSEAESEAATNEVQADGAGDTQAAINEPGTTNYTVRQLLEMGTIIYLKLKLIYLKLQQIMIVYLFLSETKKIP
jgi:hypothetical protein